MLKRRPEYLILSVMLLFASLFCTVVVCTVVSGVKCTGVLKDDASSGIVSYCAECASISDEDKAECIKTVQSGFVSAGDFAVAAFESPQYLISKTSDEDFISDLAGLSDELTSSDIENILADSNRIYVTAEVMKSLKSSYAVSSVVLSDPGTSVESLTMLSTLKDTEGYTVGIKSVNGSMVTTGERVRTDIFVDGSLYRAYLKYDDSSSSSRAFVLSWDTTGVPSGSHEVYALIRSSDGRGTVAAGGKLNIPAKMTIESDRVSNGTLSSTSDSSWYTYDCKDRDCYVNFVELSDDIKVSLYDVCGNIIGTNDIPGTDCETLRALMQDTSEISEETGIEGISNCFYVKVERGDEVADAASDITYKMVQSKDVAYYNDTYMAVASDTTGDTVKLIDLSVNTYEVSPDEVEILPINGHLAYLKVTDSDTGQYVSLWPDFDGESYVYAKYFKGDDRVTINVRAIEGYAAAVKISTSGAVGEGAISDGSVVSLPQGESVVTVNVTGFSGNVREYNLYFLNGTSSDSFSQSTLPQFPESYYNGIYLLHKLHPDYVFTAYDTGLDFDTVLANEDSSGRSLLQYSSFPSYVKSDSKIYDSPDWMAAKTTVVSYYLDPRNFLMPDTVFMFENLSFDGTVHTVEGVKNIIAGSFMDTDSYDYATVIYEAGRQAGVSPYFLASRIIQEMGYSGQSALSSGSVEGYEGYYNYYNIGSSATTAEGGAVLNGAKYAKWGSDPDAQEITEDEALYLLPWDSIEKAIKGGALWIASGYISAGQNTLYFQKFDVTDEEGNYYIHQYAQNIMMAYSESLRYYDSYESISALDSNFEFIVPVYDNMPVSFGELPE